MGSPPTTPAEPRSGSLARAVLVALGRDLRGAARDLAPIVIVVVLFQAFLIGRGLPDLGRILVGAVAVLVGLALFVRGLNMGLFPIGELMAAGLARRGSTFWLVTFAFLLGFTTTIAEPALLAVAHKAAGLAAASGAIADTASARDGYALALRITVALSVGFAIVVGVIRIIRGWDIRRLIIGGYLVVLLLTLFAPADIIGIAYDAGGVTTSTVTVPLVTALGVGLASAVRGRNVLVDGFGLIAFASLTPIMFVLGYGIVLS